MSEEKSSYRQIFKATSIFGGVQVFNILISIIRSKVIAVLLGPAGMGIAGLLQSAITLIASITDLGIGTIAVRNIAEANASNDSKQLSYTASLLNKLVWCTGLLGLFVTLTFSSTLSFYTFGNKDYTLAFVLLSISLLINQLTLGKDALLQGMRKVKHLAFANMIGSVLSLLVTIPLYFFYAEKGIVPAMIVISFVMLIIAQLYSAKLNIKRISIPLKEVWQNGKNMLKFGFLISLSGLLTAFSGYYIRKFIGNNGSIVDVGLYSAGFAIINTYVGLIFSAMGTDFYPRLSAIASDNVKSSIIINQQIKVALLILGPVITAFIVFIKFVIIILYSKEFLAIDNLLHWAALAMYFKACSWAFAFIFLAKNASRSFFFNELLANLYMLLLNIIGYVNWGLDGLGYAFFIGYLVYFLQVLIYSAYKYRISLDKSIYALFSIMFICSALAISVFYINESYIYYGIIFIVISGIYSYNKLNKILDFGDILKSRFNRN